MHLPVGELTTNMELRNVGRGGRVVRPSISAHLELGDGGGAVVVRAEGLKLLVELVVVVRRHRWQVALGVERCESLSDCRTVRSGCGLTAAWAAEGMLLWRARSSPGRPDAVRARRRGSRLRGPRGGACLQRARRAIKYCSAASRAAVVRCRGVPEST